MEKEGAPWVKLDIPASTFGYPGFMDLDAKTFQEPTFGGEETIDGKQALVYSVVVPSSTQGETPQQIKVWVDSSSGLLLKMVIDGQVQSVASDTGEATTVPATTTMMFEYDPTTTIEAPQVGP